MPTPPVNGKPPLGYRIGTSDRTLGDATTDPSGFIVLNQTNNKVFKSQGGVWVDATGTFPADLLSAWYGTVSGQETEPGFGYRIGDSDRTIGAPTVAPANFLVLNTTNGKVFKSQGGVWIDGGTFPAALLTAWRQS